MGLRVESVAREVTLNHVIDHVIDRLVHLYQARVLKASLDVCLCVGVALDFVVLRWFYIVGFNYVV